MQAAPRFHMHACIGFSLFKLSVSCCQPSESPIHCILKNRVTLCSRLSITLLDVQVLTQPDQVPTIEACRRQLNLRFLPAEPKSCPAWLCQTECEEEPASGSFTLLLIEGFDQLVKSNPQVTQPCIQSKFVLLAATYPVECWPHAPYVRTNGAAVPVGVLRYLCLCAFQDMLMCCIDAR